VCVCVCVEYPLLSHRISVQTIKTRSSIIKMLCVFVCLLVNVCVCVCVCVVALVCVCSPCVCERVCQPVSFAPCSSHHCPGPFLWIRGREHLKAFPFGFLCVRSPLTVQIDKFIYFMPCCRNRTQTQGHTNNSRQRQR